MPDEEYKTKEEKKEEREIEKEAEDQKPAVKIGEEEEEREEEPQREVHIEDIEGVVKHQSAAPTKVPRSFKEQEVPYESGGVYRLYKYIKDAWKKVYDNESYVELAPSTLAHTQSTADDWEDWDLSGTIPAGATSAQVLVITADTETGGVRKNGSSLDARYLVGTGASIHTVWTVLLDSGRVIETYHSNNSNIRFRVIGYWT